MAQGEAPALADVLDSLVQSVCGYIVFAVPEQPLVVALWTAHTHLFDQFDPSISCAPEPGETLRQDARDGLVRALHRPLLARHIADGSGDVPQDRAGSSDATAG